MNKKSEWFFDEEKLTITFSTKKFTHTYWAKDKKDFDKKVKEIKK